MREKKVIGLVIVATVLLTLHLVDYVLRGDLPAQINAQSISFLGISFVLYAVIGMGLYFYLKGKLGPGYWTVMSAAGLGFSWLSHFSPYTDQTPAYILGRYSSASAGWLALGCLIALMVVLVLGLVHAGRLWVLALRAKT